MKLVFPNAEHPQVLLSPGINRVGSAANNAIILSADGIRPLHCEIHVVGTRLNLQVPANGGTVAVNGKFIADLMALRAGDQIMIGSVAAKLIPIESTAADASYAPRGQVAADDSATRVRAVLPKFVLRGVSGSVFGKLFPVAGPTVLGRSAECDIALVGDEVSRRHTMLKPTEQGLSVEDLGSSNGTFINNKRIQQGFLNPGDELRVDTVRMVLVAPGSEIHSPAEVSQPVQKKSAASFEGRMTIWIAAGLTITAIVLAIWLVTTR